MAAGCTENMDEYTRPAALNYVLLNIMYWYYLQVQRGWLEYISEN